MKKIIKTEKVVKVFNLIKDAKYSKMTDSDKILIWKIFKAIKPIGNSFTEDVADAQHNFAPYERFFEDLHRASAYESAKEANESFDGMSDDEYGKFIEELTKYNKLVNDAIKEYAEKEVTLEFEPLTYEAFVALCVSNDWTFSQADIIEELVCE